MLPYKMGNLEEEPLAASMDRLPLELLQMVLFWACHNDRNTEYALYMSSACSLPFHHTLLQVCSRWKAAALSCVSLWSTITLIYSLGPNTILSSLQLRHYRRHLQMALVSSRNMSIDSCIVIESEPNDEVMGIVQDFVATSTRWRSFVCCIQRDIPADIFLPLRHNIPRLLSMEFFPMFHGESCDEFLQVFSDAPNLVSASFHLVDGPSYFNLPWHNLRTFEIQESINIPFDEEFIPYFTNAASSINLESLVCDVIEPEDSGFDNQAIAQIVTPVVCPSLREINVVDPKLLSFLTIPKLSIITIRILTHELIPTYSNLFSRSRCDVQEVKLENIMWADMQPLCTYLPHLRKLTATASDLPGAAIMDELPDLEYLKITLSNIPPTPQLLDAAWDIILHSNLKRMDIYSSVNGSPDMAALSSLSQEVSFRYLKTTRTPAVKLEVEYFSGWRFESNIRDPGIYDVLLDTWRRWRWRESAVDELIG